MTIKDWIDEIKTTDTGLLIARKNAIKTLGDWGMFNRVYSEFSIFWILTLIERELQERKDAHDRILC